nr:growth hormone secretagogue receptor type 1-like [Danaus plexippus plexippus]
MTILSIERYMAICCPLRKKSSPPLKLIIGLTWVIAILETASEIPTVTLIKSNSFMICYTVPTTYARIINGILALVTFIIPLGILIYVYSMIAFKVKISDKVNVERNMFNYRGNGGKVNKLLVAMIVSFVICWSPCCILRILIFGLNIETLMEFNVLWDIGYRIVLINSWLSTILNPLLFSLMSSKFRKAFKKIYGKQKFNNGLVQTSL